MNEYNKTDIRRLLDLYYEGKTSSSDESALRDYFARPDTDPEFDDDKLFFGAITGDDSSIEVPAELEQRLNSAIDSWEESEQKAVAARRRFKFISFRRTIGIAASITVLFAIGAMLLGHQWQNREPADTFTDPMEAYAETQRVLTLFANTIDKSMQGMETAERSQDKAMRLAFEQHSKI